MRAGPLSRRGALTLCAAVATLWGHLALAQSAHQASAELLLQQIQQAQGAGVFADPRGQPLNRYGGSWSSATEPSFIRFADPLQGVLPGNLTTCSPFLSRLFQAQYGWNWNQEAYRFNDPVLGQSVRRPSPEAYQYGLLIQQGLGFTPIQTLNLALPGDVLAWWVAGSPDNDHVMLIQQVRWNTLKPYPSGLPNSNPALAGTQFVEVRVIDSSADTHSQDTRWVAKDGALTHIDGLGAGTIGLLLDINLRVIGRTWSLPEASYDTQKNTWVKSLNGRLKLAPAWGFAVGRLRVP